MLSSDVILILNRILIYFDLLLELINIFTFFWVELFLLIYYSI